MSLHRSVVAAALAATLLTAGCSDDSSADPTPVTAGPTTSVAPTTAAGIETTTTVAQAATSTTSVSPPVTKPLTTAPPSQLLAEVTAAYDAAYADLLAAGSIPDENYAGLANHVAGAQLETIKEMLRRSVLEGVRGVQDPTAPPWSRVEGIEMPSSTRVILNVCRFDNTDAVDAAGNVVSSADRPFRYLETIELLEGTWKWTAREWIDESRSASDCASPAS